MGVYIPAWNGQVLEAVEEESVHGLVDGVQRLSGLSLSDIFSLKHESSIFRSVIQPCMWFLHDKTG